MNFDTLFGQSHTAGAIVSYKQRVYSAVHNRIRVFDVASRRSYTLPFEATGNISKLIISPNGKFLMTIDTQSLGCLLTSQGQVLQFNIFNDKLVSAEFSQDCSHIAAGYPTGVCLYRTNLNKLENELILQELKHIQTPRPEILKFAPDSSHIIVCDGKSSVKIYNVQLFTSPHISSLDKFKAVKKLFPPTDFELFGASTVVGVFTSPSQNADVTQFAQQLTDQTLSEQQLKLINDQYDAGLMATFNVTVVNSNGTVQVFNTGGAPGYSWTLAQKFEMKLSEEPDALTADVTQCDQTNNTVGVCDSNGNYSVYNTDGQFISSASITAYPLTSIRLLSGTQVAVASNRERSVYVFNHQSESFEMKEPTLMATCSALSPDGAFLAVGTVSGDVFVYSTATQLVIQQYTAHNSLVKSIQFFASTKAIASAAADAVICYDLNRQQIFRTLKNETNLFELLSVESNGEVLAVTDQNRSVHIFDVQTSKLVDTLPQASQTITKLQFSQDGSGQLFYSSWDGTVSITDCFAPGRNQKSIQETAEVLGFCLAEDLLITFTADGAVNYLRDESQELYVDSKRHIRTGRLRQLFGSDAVHSADHRAGTFVGGGRSNNLIVLKNGQLAQKIAISINEDFDGTNPDSNGFRRGNSDFSRDLEAKTREIDLRTRRVLDPIAALEHKRLEVRVLDVALSKDAGSCYVLTSFGVLRYRLVTVRKGTTNALTLQEIQNLVETDPVAAAVHSSLLDSQELFEQSVDRMDGGELLPQVEATHLIQSFARLVEHRLSTKGVQLAMSLVRQVAKQLGTKPRDYDGEQLLQAVVSLHKAVRGRTELVNIGKELEAAVTGAELGGIGKSTEDVEDQVLEIKTEARRK